MMQRIVGGKGTTVPVPDHRFIKIGTLQSIIRQSGVPKSAFVR